MLVGGSPAGELLNVVFLALMFPGMLLSVTGSTLLGIALLRDSYAPRLTAWLLALAFPLMLVGSDVLGHNSLGMVPLFARLGRDRPAPLAARAVNQRAARPLSRPTESSRLNRRQTAAMGFSPRAAIGH